MEELISLGKSVVDPLVWTVLLCSLLGKPRQGQVQLQV